MAIDDKDVSYLSENIEFEVHFFTIDKKFFAGKINLHLITDVYKKAVAQHNLPLLIGETMKNTVLAMFAICIMTPGHCLTNNKKLNEQIAIISPIHENGYLYSGNSDLDLLCNNEGYAKALGFSGERFYRFERNSSHKVTLQRNAAPVLEKTNSSKDVLIHKLICLKTNKNLNLTNDNKVHLPFKEQVHYSKPQLFGNYISSSSNLNTVCKLLGHDGAIGAVSDRFYYEHQSLDPYKPKDRLYPTLVVKEKGELEGRLEILSIIDLDCFEYSRKKLLKDDSLKIFESEFLKDGWISIYNRRFSTQSDYDSICKKLGYRKALAVSLAKNRLFDRPFSGLLDNIGPMIILNKDGTYTSELSEKVIDAIKCKKNDEESENDSEIKIFGLRDKNFKQSESFNGSFENEFNSRNK